MLTKQDIVRAVDTKWEEVDVPEWGDSVRLYVITAGERLSFESKYTTGENKLDVGNSDMPFALLAMCMKDSDGKRYFDDTELGLLKDKSSSVITGLFEKCVALNWADKKSLDKVKKNSTKHR